MSTSLPERPDLDQLRRQAKELRNAARRGDLVAAQRIGTHHPSVHASDVSLAVAQLVVARELGFSSWPKLKPAIDSLPTASEENTAAFVAASIEGRAENAKEWPVTELSVDPAQHEQW
jgi:hypothetical protein